MSFEVLENNIDYFFLYYLTYGYGSLMFLMPKQG